MSRSIASLLTAVLLFVTPLGAAPAVVVGVVVQAERAHLDDEAVTAGATLYDGDRLRTFNQGTVRLRAGAALLHLGANTEITLHRTSSGTLAELTAGTLVACTSQSSAIEVLANGAQLRPGADGPSVTQITMLEPKLLQVTARRGTLRFSYAGESDAIPEGATYRVLLDPQGPAGVQTRGAGPPKPSGRPGKAFLLIVIGAVALPTGWAIHEAFESPHRP